jgi:hypothetical protein
MWGTVLLVAMMAATDPVRFGIAVLLISRPRPMVNLLAFWLGGMAMGIAVALGALVLLRDFALMVMQTVSSAAASSTARYLQVAFGVLALLTAALIAVGFSVRQRAQIPMPCGGPSALVLQSSTPTAFSRLSARARSALEGGNPWVAFVVGIGSVTPAAEYLMALIAIAASRAAIGTQVSAAVVFTIVVLAVVELPLVIYVATPAKTQAVMLQLHNWVRTRRRRIFAVSLAVMGVMLMATGVGSA